MAQACCCCATFEKFRGNKGEDAAIQRPSPPFTVRLSLFAPVIASLFAVGMLVAPSPVVPLFPSSLLVVRAVVSMVLLQVAPVCPILMIVPIMIIAMITIIDS